MEAHNKGTGAKYLRGKGPGKLVYKKKFATVKGQAQAHEREIKEVNRKKEALNKAMNKRLEWSLLILLAAGGVFLWCRFPLPRFQSIDLSVSQSKAVEISEKFLRSQHGVDLHQWV